MDPYSAVSWSPVFSALVGASASLTGLLFVSLSINLNHVIKEPGLVGRAVEVLVLLISTLILSGLLLMPGQDGGGTAIETLAVALLEAAVLALIHIRAPRRALGLSAPMFAMRIAGAQSGPVLLLVGGVSLLAQNGGGLYWVVPAMLAAMVAAIIGAWVMLVEIVR